MAVESSPNLLYAPYAAAWLIVGFFNLANDERERFLRKTSATDSAEYVRVLRAKAFIASTATALCTLGLLYLSELHVILLPLVNAALPWAPKGLAWLASHAVDWVCSAFVGIYVHRYLETRRKKLEAQTPHGGVQRKRA